MIPNHLIRSTSLKVSSKFQATHQDRRDTSGNKDYKKINCRNVEEERNLVENLLESKTEEQFEISRPMLTDQFETVEKKMHHKNLKIDWLDFVSDFGDEHFSVRQGGEEQNLLEFFSEKDNKTEMPDFHASERNLWDIFRKKSLQFPNRKGSRRDEQKIQKEEMRQKIRNSYLEEKRQETKIQSNVCMICGEAIETNYKVLACRHKIHKDCFLDTRGRFSYECQICERKKPRQNRFYGGDRTMKSACFYQRQPK